MKAKLKFHFGTKKRHILALHLMVLRRGAFEGSLT